MKYVTLILILANRLVAGQFQTGASQGAGAPGGKSVWDSVYTTAQADSGKARYEVSCSGCHGSDLNGGRAQGLRGDAFIRDWGADSLGRLYRRMKSLMPRNAPASL